MLELEISHCGHSYQMLVTRSGKAAPIASRPSSNITRYNPHVGLMYVEEGGAEATIYRMPQLGV